jgi:hypothetical protein
MLSPLQRDKPGGLDRPNTIRHLRPGTRRNGADLAWVSLRHGRTSWGCRGLIVAGVFGPGVRSVPHRALGCSF